MKRLTYRENDWVGVHDQTDGVVSTNSQAVHRLAEFEDFIEEQGFEDLEDLKRYIELSIKSSEIIAKKRQEIRVLKDMWGKLKEWLTSTIKEKQKSPKYFKLYDVLEKIQELEKESK